MKKLLAILLAVLTVFSFCTFAAAAEDVTEPASETQTEPAETFRTFDICKDEDFRELHYMEEGNDKATILKAGDKITTSINKDVNILVTYFPDADGLYIKDKWTTSDTNNLAFSPSQKLSVSETFVKENGKDTIEATVRGLGDTIGDSKIDFTIAYSEDNTFLGWVVYKFDAKDNKITLVGVWDKRHKDDGTGQRKDDVTYILDFFFNIRRAMHDHVTLPLLKVIRTINNAILVAKTWLYTHIFREKTAE